MSSYRYNLFAGYFQFYLQDEKVSGDLTNATSRRSGTIVMAGCTDYFPEAARIQVEPGNYRARIYYGELNSLSEDGLDGDDHYKVALRLSERNGVNILKERPVS